jgi:hypothetical protein
MLKTVLKHPPLAVAAVDVEVAEAVAVAVVRLPLREEKKLLLLLSLPVLRLWSMAYLGLTPGRNSGLFSRAVALLPVLMSSMVVMAVLVDTVPSSSLLRKKPRLLLTSSMALSWKDVP